MEQKNISLSYGIHRSPSLGNDGELSELVNLIPQKGELVNLQPPKETGITLADSEKLIYIHATSSYKNYILLSEDEDKNLSLRYTTEANPSETKPIYTLPQDTDIKQLQSIGNTLILITNKGIDYVLFKEGTYKHLGQKPPEMYLTFSLNGKSQVYVDSTGKDTGKSLWMIQKNRNDSQWNTPVRVSKETEDVHSGEWKTYVFRKPKFSSGNILIPSKPSGNDYIPKDWKDVPDSGGAWCLCIGTVSADNTISWSEVYLLGEIQPSNTHFRFKFNTNPDEAPPCDVTASSPSGWVANPPAINTDENSIQTVNMKDGIPEADYKALENGDINKITLTENDIPIVTQKVMACVNGWVHSAVKENMFVYPFFVRYAYRLFDGSHIMHSAPILMVPNSAGAPMALINRLTGEKGAYKSPYFHIVAPQVALEIFKIDTDLEILKSWSDIVTGIDIFISEQFYGYDQSGSIKNIYSTTNGFPYGKAYTVSKLENYSNFGSNWYHYLKMPILSDKALYGTDAINAGDGVYQIGGLAFMLPDFDTGKGADKENQSQRMNDKIRNNSQFYLFKSFSLDEDEQDYIKTGKIEAGQNILENIYVQPTLKDDYQTHDQLIPNYSFVYNERLNISNITIVHFDGFPAECQCGYNVGILFPFEEERDKYSYNIYIYIRGENNNDIVVKKTSGEGIYHFPDYLFYPDPKAYKAVIVRLDYLVSRKEVKLKEHPHLNGAYWFGELSEEVYFDSTIQPSETENKSEIYKNKIYTSEVGNPFVFPLSGINTVGLGEILGITSATKALSQGQFGQFPLYAFSTDGIWALTVGDTGLYTSTHPVSRDVCTNPKSITPIDAAIVFATDQGLKLLQGSEVVLLSGNMEGENTDESIFNVKPEFSHLFLADTEPFTQMMSTCAIAYDYSHNLLHLFPEGDSTKHYVYSLESGEYASYVGYALKAYVPGYPQGTIQIDNKLCTFEKYHSPQSRQGVAVTRQLAFDDPFAMKVIHDLRTLCRRTSADARMRVALFVSNDGYRWVQLRSLRMHSFKFYRFVLFSTMTDTDAVSGVTFRFDYRRTNKLR